MCYTTQDGCFPSNTTVSCLFLVFVHNVESHENLHNTLPTIGMH